MNKVYLLLNKRIITSTTGIFYEWVRGYDTDTPVPNQMISTLSFHLAGFIQLWKKIFEAKKKRVETT